MNSSVVRLLCLTLAALLTACVVHPCGKSSYEPKKSDFVFHEFCASKEKRYYVATTPSKGTPMLVMHGLGGLDAATLEWAKHLETKGWKVYLPLLDGDFGKCEPFRHSLKLERSGRWKTDELEDSGQVLADMHRLAEWISAKHGNARIVAVGNCLTGAFPLALIALPCVKTAVLCQPALPARKVSEVALGLPQDPQKRRAFAIPNARLTLALKALKADPSKRLLGFHYLHDPLGSFDKFDRLHDELQRIGLGQRFRPVVLINQGDESKPWWKVMPTDAKPEKLRPHVTLTGAIEPDRGLLRDYFDKHVIP
jgi:dienelactone hydrolase